jgi:hypothetical protein
MFTTTPVFEGIKGKIKDIVSFHKHMKRRLKKDLVRFMRVIMNGKLGKHCLLKGYQKIIEK